MFNLPTISTQLVDAQFLVNTYQIDSSNTFATFQLYDVTNSINALTNTQAGATGIFADLGNGMTYGGRDIYTNEAGHIATIPLNNTFLGTAMAASGGSVALGGAVTSFNGSSSNQDLFAFSTSSTAADAQLWLGYYTKPVAQPVIGNTPLNLGGGLYQSQVTGTAGITNEIQGSFDFQRWDYITDVPMTTGTGTFNVPATTINGMNYRFYRAEPLQ